MSLRAFQLYYYSLKLIAHRLRYELAKEIVVTICASAIIGLFLYIFNDFLNVQVASLSAKMQRSFALAASYGTWVLATMICVKWLRATLTLQPNLQSFAHRLGEKPSIIHQYLCFKMLTIYFVCFTMAWILIYRLLIPWPLEHALIAQLLSSVFILTNLMWRHSVTPASITPYRHELLESKYLVYSRQHLLFIWRLKQIIYRNPVCRLCIVLALIFAAIHLVCVLKSIPIVARYFFALVTGLFLSLCQAFQLQEDLKYSWFEKNLGLSHDEVISSYFLCGLALSLPLGCIILANTFFADSWLYATALKEFILVILPSTIMPYLLFQIDGRRASVQAILVVIISLFIGTAIIAHWLGLMIWPFFKYYAHQFQQGRFYRA